MRQKLQAIVNEQSTFWNVSMSFAMHNRTSEFAVAYGANSGYNSAHPRQLTIHDAVPLGSATKAYSAVIALRLAEQKVIDLDDVIAVGVDSYLAVQEPCADEKAYCASICIPTAHCLSNPAACLPEQQWTGNHGANCSYCLRTLHCHCDGTTCPAAATLRMLWLGDSLSLIHI